MATCEREFDVEAGGSNVGRTGANATQTVFQREPTQVAAGSWYTGKRTSLAAQLGWSCCVLSGLADGVLGGLKGGVSSWTRQLSTLDNQDVAC